MRVTVDLDPKDVWRIHDRAEREGVTPGEIVRRELSGRRETIERRDRIRARVLAGLCDADIAAELNTTTRSIAEQRRGMGLPANKRYRRRT